ncbi:MAG: DUF4404 family protein [Pirellulales bacterium]|nr:DUF4404 family protein [Pirellulales bacterium]
MSTEPSDKIRRTLAELHAELAHVDQLDVDVKELLARAAAEIEGKLQAGAASATAPAGTEASGQASLEERLADAARHFEVSHPTLAGMIETLSNALSQLGI